MLANAFIAWGRPPRPGVRDLDPCARRCAPVSPGATVRCGYRTG